MPQRRAITLKHRALKTKKLGAKSKSARENKGTTAAFPLSGPIPSVKRGLKVEAATIDMPAVMPAKKAVAAKAPAKTAAKK